MGETYQLIIWLDSKHASGSEDSRFRRETFLSAQFLFPFKPVLALSIFPGIILCSAGMTMTSWFVNHSTIQYALHINCYQISNQKENFLRFLYSKAKPLVFTSSAALLEVADIYPLLSKLTRWSRANSTFLTVSHISHTVERTLPCEKSIDIYSSKDALK